MTTHDPAGDQESVYAGLLGDTDASHWAFGTGFDDPLAGVDTAVPDGVDRADLAAYCLMLGDDALVLAQRLAEWCSRAPELEEDVTLANIALDLLGQARPLLARAAQADPGAVPALPPGSPAPPEDALAFFRDEPGFRNVRLVETANGDFARSTVRLLLFAVWRLALLERLRDSRDPVLAAVAAKGVKEVAYHRDHAARWTVVLARGTEESARRVRAALEAVWPYHDELFQSHPVERRVAAAGVGPAPEDLRAPCAAVLGEVWAAAGLAPPEVPGLARVGGRAGRDGVHTEELGRLLAEMQSVARAHPLGSW
ncbi:phenylacetate-CoA oxygenase subunit PaaC [Streptomonospora sp. S1-112]|uniref:Phenylacetate-CoA oxygenase subunit PaaC n=1 Tax=Streptomonospora mangrovi TaxID=2883123 RepID=A0A9X3NPJ4_9ACTN|nr:1,2-phenylacetyl-CoA epoxidase subunit PaaC [Streptomonospora mangrovi]MDA0567532.1 phenylacetate-CoA oxygenase subunit PaaC [Streptomonospora mangrovi]